MPDFQVGFPDGQYMAHGVDTNTALKLADIFHRGGDPQSTINAIEDEEVREVAQRITNNLANHSVRGKGR